MNLLMRV